MVLWDFNHRFGIFTTYNEILIKNTIFFILFFAKIKKFFWDFFTRKCNFPRVKHNILCKKSIFNTIYALQTYVCFCIVEKSGK